ncbi:MAG: hypothetical protein JWO83_1727 [Caulobacteraceae bacterium]|jgi:hypothetical protein|nr:hypothetical protein [Caulobacteraceae bacterium]
MIHSIALAAHRLDQWLQARLGRPYHVLLGIGLTVEIIRRLVELPHHAALGPKLLGVIVLIVMNLALLIHQVGQLSHHTGRARARREARRGRR